MYGYTYAVDVTYEAVAYRLYRCVPDASEII